MALPVAALFASQLLGSSGGSPAAGAAGALGQLNPLAGANTSSANTGDTGPIGFGDFNFVSRGAGSTATGGLPVLAIAAGAGVLLLVLLLRR